MKALAYLNFGRWVVDCPADGCTDAREVYGRAGQRQAEDVCARGHAFQIEMPPPQLEAQIAAVLADRPDDADKAWYPKGHERALLAGLPTGQTIADLRAENGEVAAFRARQKKADKDRIRELLAEAGVTVAADGTFKGSI